MNRLGTAVRRGFAAHRAHKRRRARLAWCAWLLAPLLCLGVVEQHTSEAHGLLSGALQEIYFPEGRHPAQPHHAEPASPARHPFCPACANPLLNGGAQLPAAGVPAAPEAAGFLRPAAESLPAPAALRSLSARGPPAVSA